MNKLNHVAIIVDGNGRWAKERGKTRSEGHLEGAKNLEKIIQSIFTIYFFTCFNIFVFF